MIFGPDSSPLSKPEQAEITPATTALEAALPTPKPEKPTKSPKPKDPNHPKRPMSTFLLFAREQRERVLKENPNLSYLEVTKLLGQLWEGADKKKYEEESQRLTEEYKKEVEEYQKGKMNPESVTEVSPKKRIVQVESENIAPTQVEQPKKKSKGDKVAPTIQSDLVSDNTPSIPASTQDPPKKKKKKAKVVAAETQV